MSYDYYIVNRELTKTEIKEKTDLEIKTQEKNGDWIVDKYGNAVHIVEGHHKMEDDGSYIEIKDDIVRQLCRYGGNNATYIMDTLVREFKMVYYSDDGFQNLCGPTEQSHDPDVDSNIKRDMMRTHGYDVIKKDTIIIPLRTEKDYETNT